MFLSSERELRMKAYQKALQLDPTNAELQIKLKEAMSSKRKPGE